ncbi:MAG: M20/M25/M40 family metallo-hydrolase [Terriglobales bacterium]
MTVVLHRTFLVLFTISSLLASAQGPARKAATVPRTRENTAHWTVKSDWVRADEDFLASDALQGRGSGTRDEEIAAEFVASKFESFGLKPAAPENSFIETVDLVTPKLDGKAQLSAGSTQLQEAGDFYLLTSTGESVNGKLQKVAASEAAKVEPGSAVLVTGVPDDPRALSQVAQRLRGAAVILFKDSAGIKQLFGMMGGKTRVPMHIKGVEGGGALGRSMTIAVLNADAFAKVEQMEASTPVSLTVHEVPTPPGHTYNAMAVLEGSDPNAEAILLSAHLDHLGIRPQKDGGDEIYNGADDDASGTTAVIELARALAAGPKPKRTVYFVCFGSEETGGQGDNYFREHPPLPLDKFVANIEFEMIGAQDPKLPKGFLLLTGWERTNLGPALREHWAKIGPDPYPEQHYFQRSDNYALALKGVVAQTAAGWGDPPYYHRPNDDLAHLDWKFLSDAIESFVAPVEWLANSEFKPEWKPGGMPK